MRRLPKGVAVAGLVVAGLLIIVAGFATAEQGRGGAARVASYSGAYTVFVELPGEEAEGGVTFRTRLVPRSLRFGGDAGEFRGRQVQFRGRERQFLAQSHAGTLNVKKSGAGWALTGTLQSRGGGPDLVSEYSVSDVVLGEQFSANNLDVDLRGSIGAAHSVRVGSPGKGPGAKLGPLAAAVVPGLEGGEMQLRGECILTGVDAATGVLDIASVGSIDARAGAAGAGGIAWRLPAPLLPTGLLLVALGAIGLIGLSTRSFGLSHA